MYVGTMCTETTFYSFFRALDLVPTRQVIQITGRIKLQAIQ